MMMAQREFTSDGGAGSIRDGEERRKGKKRKDAVLGDRRAASLAGAGSFSRRVFGRRFAAEEDGRDNSAREGGAGSRRAGEEREKGGAREGERRR